MFFFNKAFMGRLAVFCILSATTLLSACDEAPPIKEVTTRILLSESMQPTQVELTSEAIPVWREHSDIKPALLLFADDPMLQPVPAELSSEVRQLVTTGAETDIRQHGPLSAATTLLPSQALTAALQQKLFGQVVWVTSKSAESEALNETSIVDTLFQLGAINDYERESFAKTEFGLAGTILDTPFQIVYHDKLPTVDSPVVLHLDLSIVKGLYNNEIKTPLFKTLKNLLESIRKQSYQAVSTVVSYSNLANWVPLELRFAGGVIEDILTNPAILDQPMPQLWEKKGNSLYLSTFFQNEERAELYRPLIKENPDQPADVYWELYATTIKFASYEEALGHLNQAVKGDPVYALEYIKLANKAQQKGLPEIAQDLWQRTAATFPDNPYIKLQEIKSRAISGSDSNELRAELEQLKKLPWSEFYATGVIADIDATLSSLRP